jgi:hypothetical protein
MDARLHLQFHMFDSPGEVPCDSLREACEFFKLYAADAQRREREGVRAIWVTRDGETILGSPPPGWAPGPVNALVAGG